jgi:O-antigen/teichoic acid export membrane protein
VLTIAVFTANSLLNFVVGLLVAKFLGPAEYGRFTLALSAASVVQLIVFEWLRYCVPRFYTRQGQAGGAHIRATLDAAVGWLAVLAAGAALLVYASGLDLALSADLAALAIGAAIANGLFDFAAALLRARFLDRPYAVLVVAKNVLAFALTVGGAFWFGSARIALVGLMLSVVGALAAAKNGLVDEAARGGRAERWLVSKFLAYGMPIVGASVLYQSIPLLNRILVSRLFGFAEAGQFSLAYDIGTRIVNTLGSALDAVLFQLAVLDEKTLGASHARERISRNMGLVLALIAPAVLGSWLVIPSFERLLVPESFRGPFQHYFTLVAPGLFAWALINYAVNPAFQLAHRLAPLMIGALVAVVANLATIALLPTGSDASVFALAQSAGALAGLAALFAMLAWLEPSWPKPRDLIVTLAACAAMVVVDLPLRGLAPGLATMLLQMALGGGAYVATAAALDLAGLRSLVSPQFVARFTKSLAFNIWR